jgi:NAD-dependent dihydropyrimidine dehydrogenase PreA subunit
MPRRLPDIDPERCTGCGRCIAACAPHVLALERRGWEKVSVLLDAQGCTGCHHCAWRCPFEAIAMRSAPAAANPGAVH